MVVEYHHFRKHPYQNIRFLLNPKIWRRSTWLLCGEALRPVLEAARRCSLLTGTPALAKAVSDIGGKGWVAVVVVVVGGGGGSGSGRSRSGHSSSRSSTLGLGLFFLQVIVFFHKGYLEDVCGKLDVSRGW